MKTKFAIGYNELSEQCAELMIKQVQKKPNSLMCIATGGSPRLAYKRFVEKTKENNIDTSNLRIINLDEWHKIDPKNPATCNYFIKEYLLTPLNIGSDRYISFDSNCEDTNAECLKISQELNNEGDIDLAILGIGMNGHLGLNEPNSVFINNAHKVKLSEKTKTHAMLKSNSEHVQMGLTLGIGQLLKSKDIILLVSGENKEEAYYEFINNEVTPALPASILKFHQSTICIVEEKISRGRKND